jgi:hypothetical protein
MGDRWDPPGYGPPPGGDPWGPPGGGSPPTGPFPSSGGPGPGGHDPGGYDPGGYGPGGYAPGGYAPGGYAPGDYAPGGYVPGAYPPDRPPDPVSSEGFGDAELIGRPPFVWLILALVLGLVAAVVAWIFGASMWIALGMWVLAGPIAIGLLALFTQRDVQQRAKPIYDAPSWIPVLYWSAIVAAAVGIGVSAWNIADWAGRL